MNTIGVVLAVMVAFGLVVAGAIWLFSVPTRREATRIYLRARLRARIQESRAAPGSPPLPTGVAPDEETPMAALMVPPGSTVDVTLDPRDRDNLPARVDMQDQPPTWESTAEDVTVLASSDGLSATVSASPGFRGPVQIQVTVDAALAAGEIRTLGGTLDLDFVSGEAVSLGLQARLTPSPVTPPPVDPPVDPLPSSRRR